jgi:hypothetical protein
MSDNDTAHVDPEGTDPEERTEPQAADVEPEGDTFPRDYVDKLRSEAKGYRTRLREVEAQVEQLRADKLQRTVMDAAQGVLAPSVTFDEIAAAVDLDALAELDGDGITAAVRKLADGRPHLRRRFQGTADAGPRGTSIQPDVSEALSDMLRGHAG